MTARTICGWVMFMDCVDVLYRRGFHLRLKAAVYRSYIRSTVLYGSEAWCLKESEMVSITDGTERSMVREMCGVQLNDRIGCKHLMWLLGFNATIDQLAMANIFRLYGHVLRMNDGGVLRRALDFEVDFEMKKGAEEDMEEAVWEWNYEAWFEHGRYNFPIKVECLSKSDCCWVEVNLAILTCWGYCQVLDIGIYLSPILSTLLCSFILSSRFFTYVG